MLPSTVHCKDIQHGYQEKWSDTHISKCLHCSSCIDCIMKQLSKVIVGVKNSVVDKGHCRVCGDLQTDLSNKNGWFPKH